MALKIFSVLLVCGVAFSSFVLKDNIIGGPPTPVDVAKWQGALKFKDKDKIFCSVSLIKNNIALTALHCNPIKDKSYVEFNHLPSLDCKNNKRCNSSIVTDVYVIKGKENYDIALMLLKNNIDTKPIAIGQVQNQDKTKAIFYAMGAPYYDRRRLDFIKPQQEVLCIKNFNYKRATLVLKSNNGGVCAGDSGGPLLTSIDKKYIQIGLLNGVCAEENCYDNARFQQFDSAIAKILNKALICFDKGDQKCINKYLTKL